MKKTLSILALLGVMCFSLESANAFSWSSLNPAYWGHCPKCEKQKKDCGCKKRCNPCETYTGGASPCDPCAKKVKKCDPCKKSYTPEAKTPCSPCEKVKPQPCDPCDKLQNMNK